MLEVRDPADVRSVVAELPGIARWAAGRLLQAVLPAAVRFA